MKNWPWTLALVSLVVLLVGCGTPDIQPQQPDQALRATEAPTAMADALAAAASPPTDAPSPTVETPAPTVTPSPTAEEPTSKSTLPATAVPTAVPPTTAPSATPVLVRTVQDIQRLTPAEAKELLDSGMAVLYDVRSAGEYRSQHAAGALSFPEAEMVARYGELPTDRALVFY
ncbi:MAG: hypothetical protein PVF77_15360 [Anaerolineae bacterium]